jgi:histidyl-tRNA synthetase
MIQKPRGTQDYLGEEYILRREIENKFVDTFISKDYRGIETPLFEQKNLFVRSVGEQTDIVQKEMFDLEKKSDEIYSLRPELTAGIIRALVELGMKSMPKPIKVFSVGSCFRYERPQKGRKRQFNQMDIELIGKSSAQIDGEIISDGYEFLKEIGLEVSVTLNTLGSKATRTIYSTRLKKILTSRSDKLCKNCLFRMNKNPLRIWDCKEEKCDPGQIPSITESLSEEELEYYNEVKNLLTKRGVKFSEASDLVRGLDYYTGIIFEYNLEDDSERASSVGGGGRYDELIGELGGGDMPAIGFGLGFERIIEILK